MIYIVDQPITDIDGNVYKTIKIGTQIWMAENLKTTNFNDGTAIPFVINDTSWANLTTPAYCWYNNDAASYEVTYGALYNWYTVNTGKLCPIGWHVSTDAEWVTMTTYLGGQSVTGGKLKEAGTTHWIIPNTGATNKSGFTALPGGCRGGTGIFHGIGKESCWWSATKGDDGAWYRDIYYEWSDLLSWILDKKCGFSVRCLKDN